MRQAHGPTSEASEPAAVSVVVRVRPPLPNESRHGHCTQVAQGRRIVVRGGADVAAAASAPSQGSYRGSRAAGEKTVECEYDRVLDMVSSQDDVWNSVCPTVDKVFSGYNVTLFTYGMTGSGKTHTMLGPKLMGAAFDGSGMPSVDELRQCQHRGLVPRVIERIFDKVSVKGTASGSTAPARVTMSYLQIYRERCYDLLQPADAARPLRIREDGSKGHDGKPGAVYVEGLSELPIDGVGSCFKRLLYGFGNIAFRCTNYNEQSSRSHSVLIITISQPVGADPGGPVRTSKVHLVDLAGNERWDTFGPEMSKVHTRELTSINQSLSVLGSCVQALSQPG